MPWASVLTHLPVAGILYRSGTCAVNPVVTLLLIVKTGRYLELPDSGIIASRGDQRDTQITIQTSDYVFFNQEIMVLPK
jgi:hypothetical protein